MLFEPLGQQGSPVHPYHVPSSQWIFKIDHRKSLRGFGDNVRERPGPKGVTLSGKNEKGETPTPYLNAPSHNYLAT
ncbi:hypothetical protein ABZZ01_35215, partial [Streptomyces virginiae]|uniref:hypothetical protein n=1 Tax=Streptomyces virginiae TaxID=1961 RepID=UPI0033AA0EFC